MKSAIAGGFATWGICAAAYWWLLRDRGGPVWVMAILAGLFMATVIGTFRNAAKDLADARRVGNEEPPEDGQTVAVSGPIRVQGAPLEAPFSRSPAAMYTYHIEHDEEAGAGSDREVVTIKDWSGIGLAPCAIESRHGAIRILGVPELVDFPLNAKQTEETNERASEYVAMTKFEDMKGLKLGATFDAVKEMVTFKGPALRKDWRLTRRGLEDDSRMVEQVVPPGTHVTGIGRYSARERALLPDGPVRTRIVRGKGEAAGGALRKKALVQVLVALAIGIAVNGGVFALAKSKPGTSPSRATRDREEMLEFHQAVRAGDLSKVQSLAADGVPVDVRDDGGRTPLALAPTEEMAAWLIANGADVNARDAEQETVLMDQASSGDARIVQLLIDKGARLDEIEPEWKMTALAQALRAEHMDVVEVLRNAGAKDITVTSHNGRALKTSDPPVRAALAYLDAVFAEDRARLKESSTFGGFDDVDFTIWKSARPHPARLIEGFGNQSAATVHLRGLTPDGGHVTWRYDLVRDGATWKVSGETWQTRFNGVE